MRGHWGRPRKLDSSDDVTGFVSGDAALDAWLVRFALANQQAGMSSTYVCPHVETGEVLAFYAIAFGGIEHVDASARVARGLPRNQIPVAILARMAVRAHEQGSGLGRAMLRDALIRVDQVARVVGIRCLVVHAKDEAARDFYLRCAPFEQSPTDPLNLQLLVKDLRLVTGP